MKRMRRIYDIDFMNALALRIENTSESDPCSYEATKAVAKKAQKKFPFTSNENSVPVQHLTFPKASDSVGSTGLFPKHN